MAGTVSKSKLTLWVDKETKRFGKAWAKEHRESLSGLFSNYLVRLKASAKPEPLTPLVQKLSGVLKGRRQSQTTYQKHLEKKYLGA